MRQRERALGNRCAEAAGRMALPDSPEVQLVYAFYGGGSVPEGNRLQVGPGISPDRQDPYVIPQPRLLTVGHGTLAADELMELWRGAGIDEIVDVRRFPGSRRHPHVGRDQLPDLLEEAHIGYRWDERLGGRRRGRADSPHRAIRNASFRAYADHMDTEEWQAAMHELVAEAERCRVAVMCSESVWWRCHRRFIADAAMLCHDLPVHHLMRDGRLRDHHVTEGGRLVGDVLVYDDKRRDDHPGA